MQPNTRTLAVHSARRNSIALSAALAVCLALAVPTYSYAASHAKAMPGASEMNKKQKVIFQVSESDPKTWNLALNNAANVQEDLGKDNVEIELVAYGPGIGMLRIESTVGNRIKDAVAAGVNVVACENTMRKTKLTKDDMLGGIRYVKAGVVELMQKQQQGYSYIRP